MRKPSKFSLRSLAYRATLCFSRRSQGSVPADSSFSHSRGSTTTFAIDAVSRYMRPYWTDEMSRQTATRGLSVRYTWNMSRENSLGAGRSVALLCEVNLRSAYRFLYTYPIRRPESRGRARAVLVVRFHSTLTDINAVTFTSSWDQSIRCA